MSALEFAVEAAGWIGAALILGAYLLGLPAGSGFDRPLRDQVSAYQRVHGLKVDGIAGDDLVTSATSAASGCFNERHRHRTQRPAPRAARQIMSNTVQLLGKA